MRVVIAPDSFKGTLTAPGAAEAIGQGWGTGRPDDDIVLIPMSDGGDGFLDVIAADDAVELREVEVADPLGQPRTARFAVRGETAYVESAEACGLHLLADGERNPLQTTTYGVGQLLEAARSDGARRIVVGLGGSATVDGGAGALTALGYRLTVEDGGGLKIGGGELHRLARISPTWLDGDWEEVEVEVLADVDTLLLAAPREFGPQKGASTDDVRALEGSLRRFADVVERDLGLSLRDVVGTGAAGGLGFGLAAGIGGRLTPGATRIARSVGLVEELDHADLLVVGEGRLDAGSSHGKVVGTLLRLAGERNLPVVGVFGSVRNEPPGLDDVESGGTAEAPRDAVRTAAERLAGRTA